jgi:hypothetical protein
MPRVSGGIGAGGSPRACRAGAVLPMILEHNGSLTSLRAERAEGCEMAKMSAGDLKALLSAERYDALSAMAASKLSDERASALNYYMGNMSKDRPAPDGRSKAVSSDVADTIEGLMPPLMEIFAAGEEVVQFAPVGPEDVAAAEQETDYVNHVFMQQNPGFLVLYSFIKDALLSKVGVVKVWWECRQEVERETYLDQPDDAFALIVSQPGVEIVEHSEREIPLSEPPSPFAPAHSASKTRVNALMPGVQGPEVPALGPRLRGDERNEGSSPQLEGLPRPKLHDVTIEIRRTRECARAEGVTPEEFGISRRARSIKDTDYCFHDVFRTESQLIAQGYEREQVKKLPSYTLAHTIEEQARDTVNESTLRQGDDGLNASSRLIRITEHYVRMDYEGNDEAALYRCTTAGEEGELLLRDGEADVVREDVIPFAAMTPVIVTHRFFGRSIADLVMDIQRIKTALLRALLDNAYLANNPRTEVPESHATETTLDDLLVSRPGGIVRTKMPGGLTVLKHPDIGGDVFPLLQYQDTTREWRTGVSRQGQGVRELLGLRASAEPDIDGHVVARAPVSRVDRHPLVAQPHGLRLRAVLADSHVQEREQVADAGLIRTYDTELSESVIAESQIKARVKPVALRRQFAKKGDAERRIKTLVYGSGLPKPQVTLGFVRLLKQQRIVPSFW